MLDAALLAVGLAVLVVGGDGLVRGASALARQLGVSPLVVGLTVVAFGTSAPELAVNGLAALRGDTALSFGNIVGSNVANIGLIVASASLVRPLVVRSSVITREIPMMLLGSLAVVVLAFDRVRGETVESYDRYDGLVLLLFFSVFLYTTLIEVLSGRAEDPLLAQAEEVAPGERLASPLPSLLLVVAGLAGLVAGAELTVRSAVALAEALGVPKAVVGLTLVAVGTSLPELVATLVATFRGQADLAVGNVVGSNLFNLLFILPLTAIVRPVPVPAAGHWDLAVMLLMSVALLGVAMTHRRQVVRAEGLVLLVLYFVYLGSRAVSA